MSSSNVLNHQDFNHEIEEAASYIGQATNRIVEAIDAGLDEVASSDSDSWFEQYEESQAKHRVKLEAEHERRKRDIQRKWKRY